MADNKIFFDNASTTKVDPSVLEDMLPYFNEHYCNPSSLHDLVTPPMELWIMPGTR